MFGFWRVCEYFIVRVLARVRVLACSGCSSFARTRSRFGSQKASFWLRSACSGFARRMSSSRIQKINFFALLNSSFCSGCSGISVENLCKRVWESLWGRSGKVGGKTIDSHFRISFLGKSEVLHGIVEKFYYKFCTGFSLCKRGFLHSFHRVYYYNYYFLYRGKEI